MSKRAVTAAGAALALALAATGCSGSSHRRPASAALTPTSSTTSTSLSPTSTAGPTTTAVPASLAAISKAGTASVFSTQGNAFTTRTASFIIQEHFPPGVSFQPGGPLFGVQFSQLPCSDIKRPALPQ